MRRILRYQPPFSGDGFSDPDVENGATAPTYWYERPPRAPKERGDHVKYMIMMFGSAADMMETQPREWIVEMIQFMRNLDADLRSSGELVYDEGLSDGSTAKTVTFKDGMPVATDGPFAESKESIIGFWIVDVESEARAIEIASHVVAFTHGPIEVRSIPGGPPEV
ncbi:MAG: hypothetical protein QOF51_3323 [Chloroflexota bacterium]|jgi:hypothetical protein|nr:hypothetical protein [Chloroflexota bacterium]